MYPRGDLSAMSCLLFCYQSDEKRFQMDEFCTFKLKKRADFLSQNMRSFSLPSGADGMGCGRVGRSGVEWHGMVLHGMVWFGMARHGMACGMAWHGMA